MPGGDRTGPMGMGPITGRGAGPCAGYDVPGFANPIGGRLGLAKGYRGGGGFGRGRGGGRGRGAGQRSVYNPRGQIRPRFAASGVSTPAPASQTEIGAPSYESLVDKIEELEEEIGELQEQLD